MNKANWTYKPFEECFEKVKYTQKLLTKDFAICGKYPIISQEEELISGFCDNEDFVFKTHRPLVIFGDHTRVLKYVDFDFVLGADGVKILLPVSYLQAKFLYYFLGWYQIPNLGYSRHYKLLKEITLPIPPIEEQERIVAELDLISGVIEKQKAQLKELDNLAQSIFYDMFGDPIKNDKGWNVDFLKIVAPQKLFYGIVPKQNGKVWLLNLDMVAQQTGEIINRVYVDESEVGNSTMTFDTSNVLYSKLRPYLNKVVVPDNIGFGTTELVPLQPQKNILDRFFFANLLRSQSFVDYISVKVAGAKMPRVSMDVLRNFKVILPPLDLQESFAQKIQDIEQQKECIKESVKEMETLLQSRMDYYFD